MNLNEKFVNDEGDYTPTYEFRLDNFSILKNKLDKYVINYTTTNNLLDACRDSKKLQKTINDKISDDGDIENYMFNGCLKQYFPYLTYKDLNKIDNFNETDADVIKAQDERIDEVIEKQDQSTIYSSQMLVNKFHLRIYPNLNNQNYRKNTINLETIFNIFETNNDIPFISYKKRTNNLYKINKKSLGVKINDTDIKIDEEDIKEWTNNSTSRKIENLSFKIVLKNDKFLKTQYFTFSLFETGQIDIIYNMRKSESIKLDVIYETFDLINNLIDFINKQLTLNLLNINKDILNNANISFIDIVEFITLNNIIFNKKINSLENVEKGLTYLYPFFDIIRNDDKILTFKYKKTNNYFNLDDIDNLIKEYQFRRR